MKRRCRECLCALSELAMPTEICTPCWWRTKGWFYKPDGTPIKRSPFSGGSKQKTV